MEQSIYADTTIQLRASVSDKNLIDQAARSMGINRTQFMLNAAVRNAKDVLMEQTSIFVDGESFAAILDQLNEPSRPSDALKKTLTEPSSWERG